VSAFKSPRHAKPNGKGRGGKSGRFIQLQYPMLESPAYRALSCTARALLIEFKMLYNGGNNGEFWLSGKHAAQLLGVSEKTARAAIKELVDLGFVKPEGVGGDWSHAGRPATTYRLTFEFHAMHGTSHEWREPRTFTGELYHRVESARTLIKARAKREQSNISGADFTANTPKLPVEITDKPETRTGKVKTSPTSKSAEICETSPPGAADNTGKLYPPYNTPSTPNAGEPQCPPQMKNRLRTEIRRFLRQDGMTQRELVRRVNAGGVLITTPKLCQFLKDESNRKHLRKPVADRLFEVIKRVDPAASDQSNGRTDRAAA
jgi:hypothetical protein